MAGIDDYLKQNPSLAGEDPKEVAAFVFDTQMKASGANQDEFNEYFLGKQDGMIMGGLKKVGSMIAGDDEFPEMGNLTAEGIGDSYGFKTDIPLGDRLKIGAATAFGDDKDIINRVQQAYPDAEIKNDSKGNPYAVLPDGRQGYINKSGLDIDDVTRFAAKAGTYMAGGAAVARNIPAGVAKVFSSSLGRFTAGAAGAGGLDYGMQKTSGREDVNKAQVALAAGMGGVGEAAAPAVGRLVEGVKARFGKGAWGRLSPEAKDRAMNAQLKKDGLTRDDFAGMDIKEVADFAKARVHAGDSVAPDVAIAEQFGYQLTRGKAMPVNTVGERAARTSQLNKEEYLKTKEQGQRLIDVDDNNFKQNESNINNMVSDMTEGAPSGNRNAAAQRSHDLLLDAEQVSRSSYNEAYAKAAELKGEFADEVMFDLPDRMMQRLQNSDVIIGDRSSPLKSNTPTALAIIDEIEQFPQTTIKGVENIRKKINSAYADSVNNLPDRRAIRILRDEYDESLKNAIDNKLFSGDPEALKLYENARGLYAQHKRKFGGDDEIGKVIEKMLGPERAPEEIANYLFASTGLSKNNASRIAKRYLEAVEDNPEARNALRETYFQTVVRTGKTAEAQGVDGMIGSLKGALNGKGQSVTNLLFSESERGQFRRFIKALEIVQTDARRKNPSGSGAAVARLLDGSQIGSKLKQFPGIKNLLERLEDAGLSADVSRALGMPKPVSNAKPISIAPITGAINAQ